jgi:Putative zinc-finger
MGSGSMSSGCEHARGQLALASIGRLPDNERLALESHLDGCADCRAEVSELSGIERALSAAQPEHVNDSEQIPDSLRSAVLGALHTEVVRHRRSFRLRIATIAAVFVLVVGGGVAAAVSLSGGSHPSTNSPMLALSGPAGAHGTVELTAESWGTSVELHAVGGIEGQTLTVSMRTASGSWWVSGQYVSVGSNLVDVQQSCPVPVAQIDAVRITSPSGQAIMSTSTYNT